MSKYNAPGTICINNLVFQLISLTTQHKPSKENTTCVLTASAWWKTGFLGRIISQKEELTWYDREFGPLPESELVTPSPRVCTEFPFFAKTPEMLRKSDHSQHRSSSDKSSDCNNNQTIGKREGHYREAGYGTDHSSESSRVLAGLSEVIESILLSSVSVLSDQRPV